MSPTRDHLRARYPGAETFTFGDTRALCDALLALVRAGKKAATCGALREFEADGAALPIPGRRDIALDWDGRPALVIEAQSIEIQRFSAVNQAFALAEGEDRNLDGWRAGHAAYFARNGGFHSAMALVGERFRLAEDLAPT